MTLDQAKTLKPGDMIHHVTRKNADGSPMRAKVLSVKTWKTRPTEVLVSVKHGLYDYAKFAEYELNQIELGDRREVGMDIKKMIEEINAGGYGFTIETAGAGWATKYVAVDRQTSEATPVSGDDIAAKYKQLGHGRDVE